MAKWDSVTKVERNRALVEYHNNHPELSLKEIGKVYEISAVRVWAIVKRYNQKRGLM